MKQHEKFFPCVFVEKMIHTYIQKSKLFTRILSILFGCSLILSGCSGISTPDNNSLLLGDQTIILATTTSTYDSGLLDALIPVFEAESGYIVKIIAVGTGKALSMGMEGNADILLVHAPHAEKEFMTGGYGVARYLVMHNDFILIGPSSDPANIRDAVSPADGLQRIFSASASFISRGDDSGTHKKELDLWNEGGGSHNWDYYIETGQGMGATLWVASELNAYTLTDRSTYLSHKEMLNLDILIEKAVPLLNIYHAITINPINNPAINHLGANQLALFFLSPAGQEVIGSFGIEDYGEPLFFPDAGLNEEQLIREP